MSASMRLAGPQDPDAPVLTARSPVPILVVDDNAGKRMALKAVLSPLGYLIVEADSGTAALRCVMARDFAVILLDVRMPIMGGFETAALIRDRRQCEMTPIIFITAHGADEIGPERYAEGAVDFLFAPVRPDELRAKVSVFANLYLRAEELAARAREVQVSADQLRLLTDAAPIGIFQTDPENRYLYTNPRWSEITGVRAEDAAGQAWDSIISADGRAGLAAELAASDVYRDELCHRFEIAEPGADSRIVLVTSKSIPDSHGGVAGWVGTLADVTAEAGAERALSDARDKATDASRLKSDFLANMSHEIRTPMNGVIGMADLLLETDLDASQRDYAQTVRNSGEALMTIIDDILDFSKVEAGKLEIEDIGFTVRDVVDDVLDLLARSAQAKGLELVAAIDRLVPTVVRGDPGRVRQVLTNLVGNAVKFTQTGEIVVRVTQADVDADADADADADRAASVLRFEVTDTGDGISPEKLVAIFRPFVQADTSTSRKYGGTGLGLAICSHLANLMGGDCGASSTAGAGSTFWFTIRAQADATAPPDESRLPDAGLVGVSALLVDDNVTQRSVLCEYLTDWGMTVTTADCGEAALATLRNAATHGRSFAVAVLDRNMPGMDGLEVQAAIDADPAIDARLVLMMGLGQDGDLHAASRSGVGAVLTKPVHPERLRACLRAALGLEVAAVAHVESTAPGPRRLDEPEPGRLLLAEDNLINQKVALAVLSSAGYGVDVVLDGAAAVQAVAVQQYDAVLMDCQMPMLNGYEATAAIRSLEGSERHTPIIALTAGARPEDRERCLAEGMDNYLAKPVSKDALLDMVARSVRGGPAATPPLPRAAGASAETSGAEMTIDPAVLDELRALSAVAEQDFLADLVDQFVHDTDPLLAQLREALEVGDAGAAGSIAHSLQGSAATLGGRRLATTCERLASRAATGGLAAGEADLEAVENEYEELLRTLTDYLSVVH